MLKFMTEIVKLNIENEKVNEFKTIPEGCIFFSKIKKIK